MLIAVNKNWIKKNGDPRYPFFFFFFCFFSIYYFHFFFFVPGISSMLRCFIFDSLDKVTLGWLRLRFIDSNSGGFLEKFYYILPCFCRAFVKTGDLEFFAQFSALSRSYLWKLKNFRINLDKKRIRIHTHRLLAESSSLRMSAFVPAEIKISKSPFVFRLAMFLYRQGWWMYEDNSALALGSIFVWYFQKKGDGWLRNRVGTRSSSKTISCHLMFFYSLESNGKGNVQGTIDLH